MKNIVIIVCPILRHLYTVNTISNKVPISGIIVQHRVRSKSKKCFITNEERIANDMHFALRDEAERKWLSPTGDKLLVNGADILNIHSNLLDDPSIFEFIKDKRTDILITLGCSLVRKNVLDFINYGLNFHLGMSPRYRGSAGLFWPIYNMDLSRIAISILVLEDNIDGGPIVHHSRPNIQRGDQIHDIACKSVMQGAEDFSKILECIYDGKELVTKPQKSSGRVHYESAYHPRHLKVTNFLMQDGVVNDYLNNKEEIDRNVPFVTYPYIR